ncbi:UNVERIFIED_CONTAM: hypothetical protein GTU68_056651, partial [Idotea baltica]|nr:hypothetical protein [Idotea baltica]
LQNINIPFDQLGLSAALLPILVERQYARPYPIQQQAIPSILKGKDLMGIAATGSGKTGAYILPILSKLEKADKLENRHIQTLVLVPTRELATQVQEVALSFTRGLPYRVKSTAVFGGVSINPQMKGMLGVQLLIATPGRLLDLIDSKALSLASVQTLVLDEADKMLNMGFSDEMDRILGMLPTKRQNLLFSATLSPRIQVARGIDIAFLPYVINYELPRSPKDFIHRIGRTGRAENPGTAISLITPEEEHHFKVIQKKMKTRVELEDSW